LKRKRARVFFSLVKLRLLNHTVFRTFENGVRLEMLASVSSQCLFTTQYPLYYTIHGTLFTTHGVRLEMLASVSSQCLFTTQYPLYYTIHGTLFTAHGVRLETLARPFVRRRKTKARRFLKSVSHCYNSTTFYCTWSSHCYTVHSLLHLETLARPFVRKRQTIDLAAGLLHHVCMYVSMYVCVFTQTHANTKQLIL